MTNDAELNILLLEDDEAFASALRIGMSARQCNLQHVSSGPELEALLEQYKVTRFHH